jgi:hypothetical protein
VSKFDQSELTPDHRPDSRLAQYVTTKDQQRLNARIRTSEPDYERMWRDTDAMVVDRDQTIASLVGLNADLQDRIRELEGGLISWMITSL